MRKSLGKFLPLAFFALFVGFFALAAAWPIMHEGKKAYSLEDHRAHELAIITRDLIQQYSEATPQEKINKQNQLAIAEAKVSMARYKLNDAVVQVGETARLFYWLGLFSGLGVIFSYRMTLPVKQRRRNTKEATEQSLVPVAC